MYKRQIGRRLKKGQSGLQYAAAQFAGGDTTTVDRADDVLDQLLHIIGATIGESTFRQGPNPFIGVEPRESARGAGGYVVAEVEAGTILPPPGRVNLISCFRSRLGSRIFRYLRASKNGDNEHS